MNKKSYRLYFLAGVIACSLMITSCSTDDSNGISDTTEDTVEVTQDTSAIVENTTEATVDDTQAFVTNLSFIDTNQNLNMNIGYGVALGDLNGDGNLDACTVNQGTSMDNNSYRIYLGDGQGNFSEHDSSLSGSYLSTPAIGDIDGDGQLDMITGNTIWINDGQGNLSARPELLGDSESQALTLVKLSDLNGDEFLDIAAISDYTSMRVYLNDGTGHFSDTNQEFGTNITALIELGDINGDTYVDIISAGWKSSSAATCPNRIWLNDGEGNFTDSNQILEEGSSHVHGLALGDLNGDGSLDLVMGIHDSFRSGRIYLNDGEGNLIGGQSLSGELANNIALGDFDGDDSLDIFVTGSDTPNSIWLNDGNGTFNDSSLQLGGPDIWSWDVAAGDFNADSRLDVFVVTFLLNENALDSAAQIWINETK
jgi:hypothetical protein